MSAETADAGLATAASAYPDLDLACRFDSERKCPTRETIAALGRLPRIANPESDFSVDSDFVAGDRPPYMRLDSQEDEERRMQELLAGHSDAAAQSDGNCFQADQCMIKL